MNNMSRRSLLTHTARIAPLGALAAGGLVMTDPSSAKAASTPAESEPWVILAVDGSGDFGPNTPGTMTDGWQEALDFATANDRDLYVKGGYGGPVFNTSVTITVPAAQDFRIYGGCWILNWTGPDDQNMFVIDSAENCQYDFGIFVYGGQKAAVLVQPKNPTPIDGFPITTESTIRSDGMAGPAPFTVLPGNGGSGLVIDGTYAAVNYNRFILGGVLNFSTVSALVAAVTQNDIEFEHLHTNVTDSTLMTIPSSASGNRISAKIAVDQGVTGVTGLVVDGFNNILDISQSLGNPPIAPGKTLILSEHAAGNEIHFIAYDESFTPGAYVTDQAQSATNTISWTGSAAATRTVKVPARGWRYTQRLYPAEAHITGDAVRVTVTRDGSSIVFRDDKTVVVTLSPGDELAVSAAQPPAVTFVPIKAR